MMRLIGCAPSPRAPLREKTRLPSARGPGRARHPSRLRELAAWQVRRRENGRGWDRTWRRLRRPAPAASDPEGVTPKAATCPVPGRGCMAVRATVREPLALPNRRVGGGLGHGDGLARGHAVPVASGFAGLAGPAMRLWQPAGGGAEGGGGGDGKVDFGRYPARERKEASCRIRNSGDELLKILKVRSTCGACAEISCEPKELSPGDTAAFRAVILGNSTTTPSRPSSGPRPASPTVTSCDSPSRLRRHVAT